MLALLVCDATWLIWKEMAVNRFVGEAGTDVQRKIKSKRI